ncbi:hypothetical protein V3G39_03875 [Dermatophilaceae bacterium Sec6.4]
MNKSKALRVGGFTVAVAATASLVGFTAHGTGAYFSAATSGNMAASTGHVTVTSSPSTLDFTNSLPGDFKTQQVTYKVNGDGPEDVYIAFDDPNGGDYALNGYSSDPATLGRYGHLQVTGPVGTFQSYNLSTDASQKTNGGGRGTVSGDRTADCNIDPTTGLGGSTDQSTRAAGPGTGAPSYVNSCPAPQYILLSKGLNASDPAQSAAVTFGYTKILDSQASQGSTTAQIPFRIVAEQAGVSPYDANTTNGR